MTARTIIHIRAASFSECEGEVLNIAEKFPASSWTIPVRGADGQWHAVGHLLPAAKEGDAA